MSLGKRHKTDFTTANLKRTIHSSIVPCGRTKLMYVLTKAL